MKVKNHSAAAVSEAIAELKQNFGAHFSDIFKTITADNGSEFAALSAAEETGTSVYFTHPFSSREKGTNACHNKLLRRFIPKGKSISAYSPDDILHFADLMNAKFLVTIPRRSCSRKNSTEATLPDDRRSGISPFGLRPLSAIPLHSAISHYEIL